MTSDGGQNGGYLSEVEARDLSVVEALEWCLRDIAAGTIKPDMLYVALGERHHDRPNAVRITSYCAGVSKTEARKLLFLHLDVGAPSSGAALGRLLHPIVQDDR